MDKVDNMQNQIISAQIKIIRNYQTEMLEIRDIVTEVNNTFDELISRFKTSKERMYAGKQVTRNYSV